MPATEPTIGYLPRGDATSESELNALEAIYRRAIARYDQGKEGGATTAPDDAKEIKSVRAKESIPERA